MKIPTAEYLGRICLSFQGVTEDYKPEADNLFLLKGHVFAIVGIEENFRILFQATEEDARFLVQKKGFQPAPERYGQHWIIGLSGELLSIKEWSVYLEKAYELAK